MEKQLEIVHAFTLNSRGGNPAGVVNHADGLSPQQKQQIAAKAGLSETVFISQSDIATRKLEFFTPTKQIPHCGHATVAAFAYLQQTGELADGAYSKETIDGTRRIRLHKGEVSLEQKPPRFSALPDHALGALGLYERDLAPGYTGVIADAGNAFALIPVASVRALKYLEPDMDAIALVSAQFNLIGYYAYAPLEQGLYQAAARMFAPHYGIKEEAATGMAAGPLAAYLSSRGQPQKAYNIVQGTLMSQPSPSRLRVELEHKNQQLERVWVSGSAQLK